MKINEKNLCVFATSPPYDCEGFLNKRGEVNKAFQRRYFVLKGNLLFYFDRKGDKEPLGLIIVEGCTIELSEDSEQYSFEIAFNGNRTYVLAADSQESMELWMKALTCAGYEYKKLMVAELQRQLEEIEGSRNKLLHESSMVTTSIPRPPPRRQNPFNRPAPPPPVPDSHNLNANVPFMNGQFASATEQSNITAASRESGFEVSPLPPLRGTGLSSLYVKNINQKDQSQSSSVFLTPNDGRNRNGQSFEQMHEKFRIVVMKDILEYQLQRELKSKPLIEL